ncbi:hypothetical protein [Escherichia coli]|uniref:hypothetical protein n=1 Tax=Escherichia coli TaxID=562 RepID=UPI00388E1DEE
MNNISTHWPFFKELLDADVYESGNKKIIEKFESALDICLAYERQCSSPGFT